jgi:hypothetical protein
MKRLLNVDTIDDKEYRFQCYYARNLIDGRIFKNGNKALFFEPLVANSIFIYLYVNRCIYDYILELVDEASTNALFINTVQSMEDVISYYYQGGSLVESEFWDHAARHCRERLETREAFKEIMSTYRGLKKQGILHTAPSYSFCPLTWEIVDEQMGYGYING